MAPEYPLELLSPARDLACARAAIDHGADAIYIGGPAFGARAAACNSFEDIEQLVRLAHPFGVKVYVTMNTLMDDRELEQAVVQANRFYQMGVDALIIQDMGVLEADMPPIPLHGSTQMNNRSLAKVSFLEQVGLTQVVLARELSLDQIREIRQGTTVPLEFFVHGSLCVSYSGQCYMSESVTGRSANRGECAQFCRHRYTLRDGKGKKLASERYLLSLQDLDLSSQLLLLVEAGISSFKIEGRLKDENYVKNITAFYRQKLDMLLEKKEGGWRSSVGRSTFIFTPDPKKSFHRGETEYYLKSRRNRPAELRTPKATGERLGRVDSVREKYFTIDTTQKLQNGDGLCYFDGQDQLVGLRINRVEDRLLFPASGKLPPLGTLIFRNIDKHFLDLLKRSEDCRKIEIDLALGETDDGLQLSCIDETGFKTVFKLEAVPQLATRTGGASGMAERQLKKSGGSCFVVKNVMVCIADTHFYPAALFNQIRREGLAFHHERRLQSYQVEPVSINPNDVLWPAAETSDLTNITNNSAKKFYQRHGVEDTENRPKLPLMTCRYCIRHQLNLCLRDPDGEGRRVVGPLTITDKSGSYQLDFDCKLCEMRVTKKGSGES